MKARELMAFHSRVCVTEALAKAIAKGAVVGLRAAAPECRH